MKEVAASEWLNVEATECGVGSEDLIGADQRDKMT